MKKLICFMLALMLCVPALAEDAPLTAYRITIPADVAQPEESEGTYAFVQGHTRVVTIVNERVPDDDPSEAVRRLLTMFEPKAIVKESIPMAEGYVGLWAENPDRFGEGMDQQIILVLSDLGTLLILSGHDMDGDNEKCSALMEALLRALTVEGQPILLTNPDA